MKPSDFLTEAAAPKVGRKYQHIEDLVLSDGSHGGLHAIERLKHMGEEGGSIELKWDGCVHGDSVLLTSIGEMRIEDFLKINDPSVTVMAKNIESGINSFTEVLNKIKSLGIKEWVEVSLENGSSIRLTEDHEVLTSNRGWVEAGKLSADDDIVSLK